MTCGTIRPVAICIFRRAHEILVVEAFDQVKAKTFYRPLGGGIEFGETSAAAVEREVREEVSADVTDLRYVGTLENFFVYNGQPGHEIVQVHEGRFANSALYAAICLITKRSLASAITMSLWATSTRSTRSFKNPLFGSVLITFTYVWRVPNRSVGTSHFAIIYATMSCRCGAVRAPQAEFGGRKSRKDARVAREILPFEVRVCSCRS